MRLDLHNVHAHVTEATTPEREWLREYLTFDDPTARFSNADRFVELYDVHAGTFPAGLVGKVRAAAAKAPGGPFAVEVRDARNRPPGDALVMGGGQWLRDYQQRALEACLKHTRGIVKIPTGGGKTEVMAALVARERIRWLIVVPQADLLYQTRDRIEKRTGERPGIIGDGLREAGERVIVATFQSLHKALSGKAKGEDVLALRAAVFGAEGLIVDECHTLPAGSLYHVATSATRAYYRIGFSGTPLARGDKKSLFVVAQLGSVIVDVTAQELIKKGVLSRPTVRMVRVEQGSTAPTWAGVYGECVVRSTKRNRAIVFAVKRCAKPALVFVQQVGHGRALQQQLEAAGLNSRLVWGEHGTDARRRALTDLERGELDCIVCSAVFQQAIDVPGLRSVVTAAAGASTIATLQRLGRGTRVADGKDTFEVWDVLDAGHRWLVRHGEERRSAYESEGYLVEVIEGIAAGDTRRDEAGFLAGSKEQAKARKDARTATLEELAGVKGIRRTT